MIYCRECMRQINKIIRKRNNSKRVAYNKNYRSKNREQHNKNERKYYAKNSEMINQKAKNWRKGNGVFTVMHLSARARAKKKKIPYELSVEIIKNLCEKQQNRCAITDLPFHFHNLNSYKNKPYAPSIDRRDCAKGYTLDNIQITCVIVNKAKNEYCQEIFDLMCMSRMRVLNGFKT